MEKEIDAEVNKKAEMEWWFAKCWQSAADITKVLSLFKREYPKAYINYYNSIEQGEGWARSDAELWSGEKVDVCLQISLMVFGEGERKSRWLGTKEKSEALLKFIEENGPVG